MPNRNRITRWLRFRLTVSYVLFFTILLAAVGLIFRTALNRIQKDQAADILEEEWAAMRGYLRFERSRGQPVRPVWRYEREDPEQALIIERLKRFLLIADGQGGVLEASQEYRAMGVDAPLSIQRQVASGATAVSVRTASRGRPVMIRSGVVIDEKRPFFVAIGLPLDEQVAVMNRFTAYYFALLPVMILSCSLVGWFVSKRALRPVTDLAVRTELISGSNLKLRIPLRGAGDELDHLISTFNSMVARLEQSFNQARQFSTDVSHELRTPLTIIRGQLEVALMTARNEEQYREAIHAALLEVERLSNTIRALLHLSQAESGQLTLQRSEFSLANLVHEVTQQFQILAEEKNQIIRVDAQPVMIVADRVQMERLLNNLLSNAIKYTPDNGLVSISVSTEDGIVELRVSDTGRGIPPDAIPHLFDRFYRVPGNRGEEGLGLGLSFVSWIVKAHDGTIEVLSEPGCGSEFVVRLPAAKKSRRQSSEVKEAYGV
jgi:two-component system OmpR family sensor kinase